MCYQTILSNGFEFLQESTSIMVFNYIPLYLLTNRFTAWVNNPGFIFGKVVDGKSFKPGFDPSMCPQFFWLYIDLN